MARLLIHRECAKLFTIPIFFEGENKKSRLEQPARRLAIGWLMGGRETNQPIHYISALLI